MLEMCYFTACGRGSRGGGVGRGEVRIRLQHTVRGDWPIGHKSVAKPGEYGPEDLQLNQHGAVSVKTPNGWLGLKPHEFEIIEP